MEQKKRGIIWLTVTALVFLGMMYVMRSVAGVVGALSGGQGIIDLTFGITPARAAEGLGSLTIEAARYYRCVFLPVDMLYALCYCAFYRCGIGFFLKKAGAEEKTVKLLSLLPIAGAACDLLENTMIFIILGGAGEREIPSVPCVLFSAFCFAKFVFVYSSLAAVIGGALCLIKKRLSL